MKRLAFEQLLEWKNKTNRKPLIVQGARQVGKTWLMKEFGRQHYSKVAYISFDANKTANDIFEADYNISNIIQALNILSGVDITPQDTLVIFDEIQESERALNALKFFKENASEYHIMTAGSLLGVAVKQKNMSFPVGQVEFLNLYPLSFTEFLSALAKKHNLNIFGGSYIRKDGDKLKNSMPVILKDGSVLGFYDKIHLYTPDGEGVIDEGKNPCIFEIEELRVGVSICYDIRFPELFRSYINTKNPPHLLVNLSAWPLTRKKQYSQMAASRAIENQSYFLALSQCGEIKNGIFNSGCSCVYDPMGEPVARLDEIKDYIYFSLDTKLVNATRNTYPNLTNRKVYDFGFSVCEYKNGSADV